MARKRPSTHSEEQFALFLAKLAESQKKGDDCDFDMTVEKIVRCNDNGDASTVSSGDARARNGDRQLPPPPDFHEIEKAARQTGDGQHSLLTMIGQLVIGWSNNESLLIYVLMLLLETDERSAAIVFSTLNTTRARLDLVRRLMLLKIKADADRSALEGIIRRLSELGRRRNEFLHAMFSVDQRGRITHTQALRFVEGRGSYSFGERRPIDQNRLGAMRATVEEMRQLNRDLWTLLPRLREAVEPTANPGRGSPGL